MTMVKQGELALFSPEDVEMIRQYDEIRKRYKVWEDTNRSRMEAFLTENGLDSFKQDGVVFYKTKPYKKKQIDTKKLKEEGLYDLYTRDVWVKGSLRVQIEYDEEETND